MSRTNIQWKLFAKKYFHQLTLLNNSGLREIEIISNIHIYKIDTASHYTYVYCSSIVIYYKDTTMLKSTSSILVLLFLIFSNAHAQWSRCSGIEGGSITRLYQDGSTLLASSYRGMYASTDNGDHWTIRGKFELYKNDIYSIIRMGKYLLVGTGQSVIRSSDNGYTWIDANSDITPKSFAYDFIAYGQGVIVSSYPHVYRSENQGASWTLICNRYDESEIRQFFSLDSSLFAATRKGVTTSTDGGYNWSDINNGLPDECIATGICRLDTLLFLSTFISGTYQSTNRGQSWLKSGEGIKEDNIQSICTDGSFLFTITHNGNVYRSADQGKSWFETNKGLPLNNFASKIYSMNGSLFVTSNAGIYRSTNQGATWESKNSGIEEVSFNSFARRGSTLFAGSYARGVFNSTDFGKTWNEQSVNSPVRAVWSLLTDGSRLYAATSAYGIFSSSDNGASWNNVSSGLKYETSHYGNDYPFISSIASNGRALFACTGEGIYHSTNNGLQWSRFDSSIFGRRNAVDIAIYGNKIFLCVGYEIWFSDDNGNSWEKRNSPASINVDVSGMIYSGKYLYVTTYNPGIFRSSNDGLTYKSLSGNFTKDNSTPILICRDSLLFMGIKQEIYKSSDAGNSWIDMKTGFTNDIYMRGLYLVDSPKGTDLLASTNDGLWKYQLSSNNVFIGNPTDRATTFTLEQSYPNPSYTNALTQQPGITINYSVPVEAAVKVIVYNSLGESIVTLVDNLHQPGIYQVSFDTSNFSSGTYYYSLQSGDVHLFRSMLILK